VVLGLGFDSQQSFNRSFKRQFLQAPAGRVPQYRLPESQCLHQQPGIEEKMAEKS